MKLVRRNTPSTSSPPSPTLAASGTSFNSGSNGRDVCASPQGSSPDPKRPGTALSSAPSVSHGNSVVHLLQKLSDSGAGVRKEATKALGQVAEKGDLAALTGLVGRLADPSLPVRNAAVEAIAQVCDRGDEEVVTQLLELLGQSDAWPSRQAAVRALGRVAGRGELRVVSAILSALTDIREEVVHAALDALATVVNRGDTPTVEALLRQLQGGRSVAAKCGAARTLAQVSTRGDVRVTGALLKQLNSEHEEVRRAAVSSLELLAESNDILIEELMTRLMASHCKDDKERAAAADARAAVASLLGSLAGPSVAARPSTGTMGLGTEGTSESRNCRAVGALLACARNESEVWLVQRAAIESLAKIAPPGDSDTVDVLVPRVSNGDAGVRQAAITACGALAPRGERSVVAALASVLEGDEPLPFLRRAAILALRNVAPVGHARVVKALLAKLDDPHPTVRDAAGDALQQLSERGDDAVVEALLDDLLND